MRAIWKGAVSFGLVSVPVKLYSATESHDISFRQVHAKDGGRIKYQRVCSVDGEEVPYAEIAKGYETEDGEMVVLDDDDLAELPSNSSRSRPRSRTAITRMPSHLTSWSHAGPVGTELPRVASIGRMRTILPDRYRGTQVPAGGVGTGCRQEEVRCARSGKVRCRSGSSVCP